MTGVTLERHGEALVAAKRSEQSSRLANEAGVLQRLNHPGVIEFISFSEDEPLLVTAWAGTDNLRRRSPSDLGGALHLLTAVASTLADIHEAGVTHRSLSPSHVIIANDGRPVLCGFGDAGPADDEGREADRLGLLNLVKFAIETTDGQDSAQLTTLCEWLEDPRSDPSGFARAADAITSKGVKSNKIASGNKVGPIAAVAVLAVVSIGLWGARHHDPPSTTPQAATLPSSMVAPPTTPPPTTTVEHLPTTSTSVPMQSSTPLILQHDGRRYGLGEEGDVVVVGDWNCDGHASPAILQNSTGIVAVFESWPESGGQLEPAFTVPATGVESLQSESSGDCDVIRARSPYGSRIITEEAS